MTDQETAHAARLEKARAARVERMAQRQRSDVRCSMCGGYHCRDLGPDWEHPCRLCGVRHGGYCTPADGLTVEDWATHTAPAHGEGPEDTETPPDGSVVV